MNETTIASTIREWAAQPDISARSVLVTIFGDTVLPATQSFRLAQLFALTEVFGFSQRLVRTSMYRLTNEGWFTSEREGRQSRYTATTVAVRESEVASERIYGSSERDWKNADWTLVLLNPAINATNRAAIIQHLTWNGFFQLGPELLGSPTVAPPDVAGLCKRVDREAVRAVATGRFEDLESLLADGFFTQGFDNESIELAYKQILERYAPLAKAVASTASPGSEIEAFALRTMLVHDMRRIKLRFPELPASLHTPDWTGREAHELASVLYPKLSERAAPTLSTVLQVDYPSTFAGRFVAELKF